MMRLAKKGSGGSWGVLPFIEIRVRLEVEFWKIGLVRKFVPSDFHTQPGLPVGSLDEIR